MRTTPSRWDELQGNPQRNQRQRKSELKYNLRFVKQCLFGAGTLRQAQARSSPAMQLNTVEVNFTFRQLVKETTIQNWMQDTPAHFRFGIKAHQVITHIKRLKGTEDFVPRFLATIEPLAAAGKLGPVLFQLPPNLKADEALLKDFLAALPRTVPAAFEFRNASWFSDLTWEVLK